MNLRKSIIIAATASLACGSIAGISLSQWNKTVTNSSSSLTTTGAYKLALGSTETWTNKAAATSDPSGYFLQPGDKVVGKKTFTTTMTGDNAFGKVTLTWSATPTLQSGTTATYRVLSSSGTVMASGNVGTATNFSLNSSYRGTQTFTIEITLTVPSTVSNFKWKDTTTSRDITTKDSMTDLKNVTIKFEQVR